MSIKSLLRVSAAVVFAATITLSLPQSALSAETGVTDNSILIGLLAGLTGPGARTEGIGMVTGAKTVWSEINDQGGIHGRKIEWVELDTGCTAEFGIPAAKKAIYEDEVFILAGGGCSNEILGYRDMVIENKVPYSVWSSTNDKITKQPNCCFFRTCLRAGYEGVLQADFANSIPNAKRIAIIAQHDAWGQAKYDGVMNQLKKLGIEVIADEEMTSETIDATPQVLRIAKANPDVIITDLFPKPTTVFLRAAHQYGLTKLPIILHTSINDLVELDKTVGLPGAVDNAYTVTFTRDPNSADLASWNGRLKKIAPEVTLTPYSMWGVAGAQVVAEALRLAGRDLTRDSFIKAMEFVARLQVRDDVRPDLLFGGRP